MLKRVLAVFILVAPLLCAAPVRAQQLQGSYTVPTCGTAPTGFGINGTAPYPAGGTYPDTQNQNGQKCVDVTIAGGAVTTLPTGVISTDASFTVTTGGSYQTVLAANATRKACLFQNPTTATEVVTFKAGTQATAYTIAPGATFSCATTNGLVLTDAITATAATTSHAVAGSSQ